MAGKEESPIAKYKKASEHSEELSDTWQQHHHGAFHHAVEKVLKNKKTGRIEYKRLDDGILDEEGKQVKSAQEVKDGLRKEMKDWYAKNVLDDKLRKTWEELKGYHKDKFLEVFTGYNDQLVQQQQELYGGKLKWDIYGQRIIPGLANQMKQDLQAETTGHIKETHIDEIVKALPIKMEGKPSVEEAKRLLAAWDYETDTVDEDAARQILRGRFKGVKDKSKEKEKKKAA